MPKAINNEEVVENQIRAPRASRNKFAEPVASSEEESHVDDSDMDEPNFMQDFTLTANYILSNFGSQYKFVKSQIMENVESLLKKDNGMYFESIKHTAFNYLD